MWFYALSGYLGFSRCVVLGVVYVVFVLKLVPHSSLSACSGTRFSLRLCFAVGS